MRWPALVAAVVVATTMVSPADAAGCQAVRRSGRWATIELPPTEHLGVPNVSINLGGDRVALDPANGRRMFFATGRRVHRSVDGGCTWRVSLDLDQASPLGGPVRHNRAYEVVQIQAAGKQYVYALALDTTSYETAAMPAYLLVSKNGGGTWQVTAPVTTGTPAVTWPNCSNGRFFVAPGDPRVAYLHCTSYSFATFALANQIDDNAMFVTGDSGVTWRRAAGTGSAYLGTELPQALAIDPADPKKLWLLQGSDTSTPDVYHSPDGGETWKSVLQPLGVGNRMVSATALRQNGRLRIMIATKGGIVESADGGRAWRTIKPLLPAGQEGPIQRIAYELGGATMFLLAAFGVGWSGGEETVASCTQGERVARYDTVGRRWGFLPPPVAVPRHAVLQFRAPADGKAGHAVLATAYPTRADCQSGSNRHVFLMTYSDGAT